MSIKNRISSALEAFLVNPDRTVYLKDRDDGEKRVAYIENSVTVADSDAYALSKLASNMDHPNENAPGIDDKLPLTERNEGSESDV